ncbi:sensor domain-containing protein [Deinococcus maricopensis]|uniref:Integral membrane sensor signal transduction histidine kinase n=1 Tax=Deinococcus maricopensis (strain DSM 21211 / LMG 22137 / NRRL B-23946 / LB-34) TaxID=709986 RepID=E8U6T3_DEIML|nr:sensor domain-containing protein [Deinococcus maricopensis]ADV66772.1 integral membrane sensor signal transduction histidine kinase [Deinococcus maricopensis DSM 21211]
MTAMTSAPPRAPRGLFGELLDGRTYANFLYLLLAMPLGALYWLLLLAGIGTGVGLLVVLVGVGVLLGTLALIVGAADLERALAVLLGLDLRRPQRPRSSGGLLGWVRATLSDLCTYKALLFLALKFPLGIVSFTVLAVLGSMAVGLMSVPFLALNPDAPVFYQNEFGVQAALTPVGGVALFIAGFLMLVLSASVMNLMARGWAWLAYALLGDFTEGQSVQREVLALRRTTRALNVSGDLAATLADVTAQAREGSGATSTLVTVTDGPNAWRLGGASGVPDDFARTLAALTPALGFPGAAQAGHAQLITRPATLWRAHPDLRDLHPHLHGMPDGTLVTLPVVTNGELVGELHALYAPDAPPSARQLAFLASMADGAATAVTTARLVERATAAAGAQERARLARELHDSVAQALYGITLGAKTARAQLDRDPQKARESLDYTIRLAEGGTGEMKALLFSLRPDALDEGGLAAALAQTAHALHARYNLHVTTDLNAEPDLTPARKAALYRIAQEALHNAVKHARATGVQVTLLPDGDAWVLRVHDDGRGFDPNAVSGGTLGLKSMRERARDIGAILTVDSAPDAGTTITLTVPQEVQ